MFILPETVYDLTIDGPMNFNIPSELKKLKYITDHRRQQKHVNFQLNEGLEEFEFKTWEEINFELPMSLRKLIITVAPTYDFTFNQSFTNSFVKSNIKEATFNFSGKKPFDAFLFPPTIETFKGKFVISNYSESLKELWCYSLTKPDDLPKWTNLEMIYTADDLNINNFSPNLKDIRTDSVLQWNMRHDRYKTLDYVETKLFVRHAGDLIRSMNVRIPELSDLCCFDLNSISELKIKEAVPDLELILASSARKLDLVYMNDYYEWDDYDEKCFDYVTNDNTLDNQFFDYVHQRASNNGRQVLPTILIPSYFLKLTTTYHTQWPFVTHPKTKILEMSTKDDDDMYQGIFNGFVLKNRNPSIKELRFSYTEKFRLATGSSEIKDLLIVRYVNRSTNIPYFGAKIVIFHEDVNSRHIEHINTQHAYIGVFNGKVDITLLNKSAFTIIIVNGDLVESKVGMEEQDYRLKDNKIHPDPSIVRVQKPKINEVDQHMNVFASNIKSLLRQVMNLYNQSIPINLYNPHENPLDSMDSKYLARLLDNSLKHGFQEQMRKNDSNPLKLPR